MRERSGTRLLLVLLAVGALTLAGCDWHQWGGTPDHAGFSTETTLTKADVAQLHQRWQVTLPAPADGTPVVVRGVKTPSGTKDLAVVTTTAGDLVAYDAAAGGAPVWQAHHPAGSCRINNGSTPCYTTSSPAVDPAGSDVYSYGLDGRVHKHALATGAEVTSGGWPVLATRKPYDEKGSAALTVATAASNRSYLYVTLSGYPGDAGDYQGHVTTIDLATGSARTFNTLCSNQAGLLWPPPGSPSRPDCGQVTSGVWARGGVVYDAANDRVYLTTGNGTYAPGQHHWGDSVLALHPDGTGAGTGPLDAYTPTNFQQLQDFDTDLGSTAPAVLPTPSSSVVHRLGVQGGKDAKLRLLNLDNLSFQGGPGHLGGEVQIVDVPQGGEVLSTPAVWPNPADGHAWIYVTTSNGISALRLEVDGAGLPSLRTMWSRTSNGSQGSPLVTNGVVFAPTNGAIVAYDAVTHAALWLAPIGGIHWQAPALANGRVFIEDLSGHLTAFSR